MSEDIHKTARSWTNEERTSVVLGILKGETSPEEAARRHGLAVEQIDSWRDEYLAAAEEALRPSASESESSSEEEDEPNVGVWVCAVGGGSILPCLFIEAACLGMSPWPMAVKWRNPASPPRPFRRNKEVPLLCGKASLCDRERTPVHLYTAMMPVTEPFERRSTLSDWDFPTAVGCVIVLLGGGRGEAPAGRVIGALGRWRDRSVRWARIQEVPMVVAAIGHEPHGFSDEEVRRHYALLADVPVIPGPGLARVRPTRKGLSQVARGGLGLLRFVTGDWGELQFDAEYAARLLRAASNEVTFKG